MESTLFEVTTMHDDAPSLPLSSDTGAPIILPQQEAWARGQRAKIHAAVFALRDADELRLWLNQTDVRTRCDGWLRGQGLRATELPSESSYRRHLPEALEASLARSDRNWQI